MDPFRRDGGHYPPHQPHSYPQAPPPNHPRHQSYGYPQAPPPGYPPHQSYGYPQAPPPGYPPHQSYGYLKAPPPVVNYNFNHTMPPNRSNAMHPIYPIAMPPTMPGYPHYPTQNYWQPPEAYPATLYEIEANQNEATSPEQAIEPDQGYTNENDNPDHIHRDFDVVEVKREVLPPPPKNLPAEPQPLATDAQRDVPIKLEKANVSRTALPKTTAAPLKINVKNNRKADAPDRLTRVSKSSNVSSRTRQQSRLLSGVNVSDLIV